MYLLEEQSDKYIHLNESTESKRIVLTKQYQTQNISDTN